jgi:ATP-dependent exoDNAse (exonuclease V) alpha subunit
LFVLDPRQEMTGADRQWAGQYEVGDAVRYTRSSKVLGIDSGEYARVVSVDTKENRITIERENGERKSYGPRRVSGVTVYQQVERSFSTGDRVQFTAPSKELHVANRELGTVTKIRADGDVELHMDSGRDLRFNISEHPHLDYGYAVTSHSSRGQIAERVLVHVDTDKGEQLVNRRFAYVSISRGQNDAQIYTNDTRELARDLARELSRRTATESQKQAPAENVESASAHYEVHEQEQGYAHAIGGIAG